MQDLPIDNAATKYPVPDPISKYAVSLPKEAEARSKHKLAII